jgi:hypothetical protein
MTLMAEGAVTDRAPAAMIAGAIPLIDVAAHLAGDAEASRRAATELRWAFENAGFYYLAGHGVPQSLIDRTYDAAARFHAQPLASRLALKVNEHNIGYLPISNAASPQAAAQGRKPSQNDAYFLRRERAPEDPAVIANRRFYGRNQWPDDLPGFRETVLEYMRTLEALCRRLVPLYALALDLSADFFDAFRRAAPYPAHVALPGHRRRGRDGREPRAAHRFRFHDAVAAQPGAGFVGPIAERPLDRRAKHRWRLCRQRWRHPASLDERAVSVDAASRAQRLGPGALRGPVFRRSRSRLAH